MEYEKVPGPSTPVLILALLIITGLTVAALMYFGIWPIGSLHRATDDRVCIQVITPAKDPKTGEIRDFPTPCDVPEGWEAVQPSTIHSSPEVWSSFQNFEYGFELSYPSSWKLRIVEEGGLDRALPLRISWETQDIFDFTLEADYHTFDYAETHVGFDGSKIIAGKTFFFADFERGRLYAVKGTGDRTFFFNVAFPPLERERATTRAEEVIATVTFE